MDRHEAGHRLGETLLGFGRRLRPLLPKPARRWMEERFFGAVFQVTRVTNDHYGWRPKTSAARDDQNG